MPFYEYQCQACGAQVEVLQKISDAPLKKCPECGRQKLRKLVSAPVFRLKGAGWYETDFKSDKEGKRNLVESEKDAAPAEKKADEKKPEEKKPDEKQTAEKKPAEAKPAPKRRAKRVVHKKKKKR